MRGWDIINRFLSCYSLAARKIAARPAARKLLLQGCCLGLLPESTLLAYLTSFPEAISVNTIVHDENPSKPTPIEHNRNSCMMQVVWLDVYVSF